MKEMIIQALIPTATTIITYLSAWVLVEFRKFISTKTKIKEVDAAMTRITHTVETTVDDITQTVAGDYKAAAENGKLTGKQIAQLKTQAYNTVVEQVPMAIRLIAGDAVESVPRMIQAKIEQAILRQKQ